jgi:hypothetical protein
MLVLRRGVEGVSSDSKPPSTVAALIAILQKLPPDAEVILDIEDEGVCWPWKGTIDAEHFDGRVCLDG